MIIPTARQWIGTGFHHQGRTKRTEKHAGGCDCIGLIMGVAAELGLRSRQGMLFSELDQTNYSRYPDGIRLLEVFREHLYERDWGTYPQTPAASRSAEASGSSTYNTCSSGDIALFAFDHQPQHVGFLADYPSGGVSLIHSYLKAKQVVEHRLEASWEQRIVGIFGFEEESLQ